MPEKQRIDSIDVSKGIGILLVVLGHLVCLTSPVEKVIYSFHMPFFFFVSGIFANAEKYKFEEYLKRNAKRLLIPYVVVFVIGTAVTVVTPRFIKSTLYTYIKGFLSRRLARHMSVLPGTCRVCF